MGVAQRIMIYNKLTRLLLAYNRRSCYLHFCAKSRNMSNKPRRQVGKEEVNGVCKWFNAKKGYGFIQSEQGEDHFVHQTALINQPGFRKLIAGQPVKYKLSKSSVNERVKAVQVEAKGRFLLRGKSRKSKNTGEAEDTEIE